MLSFKEFMNESSEIKNFEKFIEEKYSSEGLKTFSIFFIQ